MPYRPLEAGRLDQRVTVQRRAAGVDAAGQPSGAWETVFDTWAAAEPLRGREFFAAAQIQAETTIRFRIRWRDGVQPSDRVVWRSQAHEILSVIDPSGAAEQLELMCARGIRDGA